MWHLCFGLQAGLKRFLAAFVLRLLRRAEQGWSSVLGSWLTHQHLGAQHRCPARPAPPQVAAIRSACASGARDQPVAAAGLCPLCFPRNAFSPQAPGLAARVRCLQRSTPASGLHFRGSCVQLCAAVCSCGRGHAQGGTGAGRGTRRSASRLLRVPRNAPLLLRSGLKVPRRP